MKIILNNILTNYTFKRNNNYKVYKSLDTDSFVKSIAFNGENQSSFSNFKKWAKETNFINNIESYTSSNARVLGRGSEGIVYEISDNQDYVIKQYRRSYLVPIANTEAKIYKVNDILPELNVGQHIARIEVPNGSQYSTIYHILKRQQGKPHSVEFAYLNIVNSSTIKIYLDSLKRLSELPQESFNNCVRDVQYITKNGYKIECDNPHNILIDYDNSKINFVDIYDKKKDYSNQQGEVLYSLLGAEYPKAFFTAQKTSIVEKEEARIYSNIIISKYLKAMKSQGIKFDHGQFFTKLINSHLFDEVLSLQKLSELNLI